MHAVAYFRTSSATNVGGDSDVRQRVAVQKYAATHDIEIVEEFYDAAVSGADPLSNRQGFARLLSYANEHKITKILVENASRFARDLMIQETGYLMLKQNGICLIAVDSPEQFLSDTPTAVLIRQILGAVSEFDKAMTVAKLRSARDRASERAGKRVEGRKANDALNSAVAALRASEPSLTLREMSARMFEQGFATKTGKPLAISHLSTII